MDNLKKFYDKYSVYITRPRLEIATVVVIALCAIVQLVNFVLQIIAVIKEQLIKLQLVKEL